VVVTFPMTVDASFALNLSNFLDCPDACSYLDNSLMVSDRKMALSVPQAAFATAALSYLKSLCQQLSLDPVLVSAQVAQVTFLELVAIISSLEGRPVTQYDLLTIFASNVPCPHCSLQLTPSSPLLTS
jgi:ABC-type maltose transport system permease subunit